MFKQFFIIGTLLLLTAFSGSEKPKLQPINSNKEDIVNNEKVLINEVDQLQKVITDYFAMEPKQITTLQTVEDYSWVSISLPENEDGYAGGGGVGVVQKQQNGGWRIVFMGNGLPECDELNDEVFPEELDVQCEEGGKLLKLPTREVVNL